MCEQMKWPCLVWALEYSPTAAGGRGQIAVTLGKQSVQLALGKGHRTIGARFNRFGLISTWLDGNRRHLSTLPGRDAAVFASEQT
jgi:hypothetical protein